MFTKSWRLDFPVDLITAEPGGGILRIPPGKSVLSLSLSHSLSLSLLVSLALASTRTRLILNYS